MLLGNLLAAASRTQAASAVIEMLRGLPRSAAEMKDLCRNALFFRCAVAGKNRNTLPEMEEIKRALTRVAAMSPARRAMLEASVAGTLLGWGMARYR